MTPEPSVTVRPAAPGDASAIVSMVRDLARFEDMLDQVQITEADVLRDGFGAAPRFEALIAERDGAPVGFALFFHNYSTFEGRSGLYLEDIYVAPEARGAGAGKALMARVARIALERACPRFELSVLHWNPAREVYQRLGFRHSSDWLPYRLKGEALHHLADLDRDA
jgi:GNAT superfamily N-acetyltransferase